MAKYSIKKAVSLGRIPLTQPFSFVCSIVVEDYLIMIFLTEPSLIFTMLSPLLSWALRTPFTLKIASALAEEVALMLSIPVEVLLR